MSYLIDKDGNLFETIIIAGVPEGFTDITKLVTAEPVGIKIEHLEAILVDEVIGSDEMLEYWSDGTDTVYLADDIPTIIVDGEAELDPTFIHTASIPAVATIPAHYILQKTSTADQAIRQAKMDELSLLRAPLLAEADIKINILEDAGDSASSMWRTYRQALRDITETYKKVDGDWKVITDSLVVADFVFPAKPV